MIRNIFSVLIIGLCCVTAAGQKVAVKTNLLYDALLTLDGGVEVKVAPKWTAEITGNLNAWNIGDHKWKQWMVQPEARYWFCQPFYGHFVGAHLLGGQYNFGNLGTDFKFLGTDFSLLKDHRLQGWMAGAGIAYGYSWVLDRHWNIEAEIGIGWIYTRYDKYECVGCGKKVETDRVHNYVGPTKAAVNLIYTF
ncbi:MAG: DUF3575 domain-containing protein [Muribaculaceae bacterium]|nr:DUF3575 domain-containing protein [Muribaculaceae bacterium]